MQDLMPIQHTNIVVHNIVLHNDTHVHMTRKTKLNDNKWYSGLGFITGLVKYT